MSESKTKQNNTYEEIIRPTLVLMVITLVTALFLALTNAGTKDIIARNAEKVLTESRQEVLAAAVSFSEDKTAEADGETFSYIEGLDESGRTVGYIFQNSTPGYGGAVTVLTGIDSEGKITGVQALDLNETPNLGMKVAEEAFRSQFVGRSALIGVSKQKASDSDILAVSGATISSKAFTNSVNMALKQFEAVKGGAK